MWSHQKKIIRGWSVYREKIYYKAQMKEELPFAPEVLSQDCKIRFIST
jgi:hypothetical protein